MTSQPDPIRFQIDLPELLSPHDMVWNKALSSHWLEGAPIGNGDFGAVIYGNPSDGLSFALGKNDVWNRRHDKKSSYLGDSFAPLRKAVLNGDYDSYKSIIDKAVTEWPGETPHQTTCGTLRLHLDEGMNISFLKMRVRLLDGVAELRYNDRCVRSLCSRKYGVLAIDIDRGVGDWEKYPGADPYDRRLPLEQMTWSLSRPPLKDLPDATVEIRDGIGLLTQQLSEGESYCVAFSTLGFDREETAALPRNLTGVATGPQDQQVQTFLSIVSSRDAENPSEEAIRRIRAAREAGFERILSDHTEWWNDWWMRGLCCTDDPMVDRWYYRSLYLNGSTIEPGKQLPGLQGVWCGENYPMWSGDYHSNINIQCMVWGLYTNNRLDWVEPFIRHYRDTADIARKDAREYFGIRGLLYPHAGSISGHELSCPTAVWLMVDPFETVWLLQLIYDVYRYGGDPIYLRETVWPLMRDMALMLDDYFPDTDENGIIQLEPVVHFESCVKEESGWEHNMGRNSLWAQAFIRLGYQMAIEAAEILDEEKDLRRHWQDRLDHLPPPPVHDDRIWKIFENHPPDYSRHNFMLPLVFPAGQVSAWHGPEDWRKKANATWQELQDLGIGAMTGYPWCGGQGLCEVLRIGDVNQAFCGARWSQACPNGFGLSAYDSFYGHFMQADHGVGMNRVLADCMALEVGGVLRFFTGVPEKRQARFHSLRLPGAILAWGEKRGQEGDYLILRAEKDVTVTIAVPWNGRSTVERSGVTQTDAAQEISLTFTEGEEILLYPEGKKPENLPLQPMHVQET